MNVIWMTRLEKRVDDERMEGGLLSAGELEGKWLVLWEDASGSPKEANASDVLYEGAVWSEMRAALRAGVAKLLGVGYQPALGFIPDMNLHERRMKERNEWIHCYADLNRDDALYEQLAAWRRDQAVASRRAPYWIATNRMLRLVSTYVPHTEEELRQLPGFGESKVKAYKDSILRITKPLDRKMDFPLEWVQDAVSEEQFLKWIYEQEEMKMSLELKRLIERRLLLEGIQSEMAVKDLKTLLNIDRRELMVRIEALSGDGYDVLPFIEMELQEVPDEEQQAIEEALQELGGEYLKPIFIQVYGEEALESSGGELQRRYERIRLLRMKQEDAQEEALAVEPRIKANKATA